LILSVFHKSLSPHEKSEEEEEEKEKERKIRPIKTLHK
jgi:hypothetical protein